MKKRNTAVFAVVCLAAATFGQGSLTPPGAPAPTMKTLDEVEPRFPISGSITINSAGSYYLTTNIVTSGSTAGITIDADNVTVDLNGFSILGSNGTGSGITVVGGAKNIVIQNGTICDCFYHGIDVNSESSADCIFRDLRILNNARDGSSGLSGIHYTGVRAQVKNCHVIGNQGNGIVVGYNSVVVGNIIENQTGSGLEVSGSGTYIANNIVKGNGDNYNLSAGNQVNILLCEVPESLDWPCSVKFAGTLTCSRGNINGISVSANNVSIDLAGHALLGPTWLFNGDSSGHGIYQSSAYRNLTVKNGKVENWKSSSKAGIYLSGDNDLVQGVQTSTNYYGIYVDSGASIKNCAVYENSGYGIYVNSDSTISECTIYSNQNSGIYIYSDNCMIRECALYNNYDGIYAVGNDTVIGCVAFNNRRDGIRVNGLIRNCLVHNNDSKGIRAGNGTTISDCAARENGDVGIFAYIGSSISGCAAKDNLGGGIRVHQNCNVTGNTCDGNGDDNSGDGIYVEDEGNRIDGNTVTGNLGSGILVYTSGNFITRNTAKGNAHQQYAIASGNDTGTIQTTPVNAGAWDNFEF